MLVSSFNPSQSFNYSLSLLQKTVQIRDQSFLCMDPSKFFGGGGGGGVYNITKAKKNALKDFGQFYCVCK